MCRVNSRGISCTLDVRGVDTLRCTQKAADMSSVMTNFRSCHLVTALVMGVLLANVSLAAQPVANQRFALSSGIAASHAVDNFRIDGTSLSRSARQGSKLHTIPATTTVESAEDRPNRVERGPNTVELIGEDRASLSPLLFLDESAPPKYRSQYVLVGGLLGAIVGVGGMGYYLYRTCDDCFFIPLGLAVAGAGGAVVGGLAGSLLFDYKVSRQQ